MAAWQARRWQHANVPPLAEVVDPQGDVYASVHGDTIEQAMARAETLAAMLQQAAAEAAATAQDARRAEQRAQRVKERARKQHLAKQRDQSLQLLTRPPGARQVLILGALLRHGHWFDGCGWAWGAAPTEPALRGLVRRGVVAIQTKPRPWGGPPVAYYTPVLPDAQAYWERHRHQPL